MLADGQCTTTQSVQPKNSVCCASKALVEVSSKIVITEKHEEHSASNRRTVNPGALCHTLSTSSALKPGTNMRQNELKTDYEEVTRVHINPELQVFQVQSATRKFTRDPDILVMFTMCLN